MWLIISLPFLLLLHFLPSIIGRNRPDILIIFLINLLAGWSIIGWFVALYLAIRKQPVSLATHTTSVSSVADELAKLRDLRDQGVLTQEEFERQKNNLLT